MTSPRWSPIPARPACVIPRNLKELSHDVLARQRRHTLDSRLACRVALRGIGIGAIGLGLCVVGASVLGAAEPSGVVLVGVGLVLGPPPL